MSRSPSPLVSRPWLVTEALTMVFVGFCMARILNGFESERAEMDLVNCDCEDCREEDCEGLGDYDD